MSEILTVRQLTNKIKNTIEKTFPYVWVKGEVTNCSRPSSGHVYFSLSDQDAFLHCVWFKRNQRNKENFDPLTGEVFEDGPRQCFSQTMTNGQHVLCAGTLSLYPPHGSYQLLIDFVQLEGTGTSYLAFEQLKNKLQQQGYFDLSRKRNIPKNPKNIAVITAPTGAAIQDFIRLSKDQGIKSSICIYPVTVQGDNAPLSIINAIKLINASKWADVIVIIRGGGAYQDLMAFNNEQVVDAVFTSQKPIVAGIGHESDVTLVDMTADLRAATPSHAAQLLWTEKLQTFQQIDTLEIKLTKHIQMHLHYKKQYMNALFQMLYWYSPKKYLEHTKLYLTDLQKQLSFLICHLLKIKNTLYTHCTYILSQKTLIKACTRYKPLLQYLCQKAFNILETSIQQKRQSIEYIERYLSQKFLYYYQQKMYQYKKIHFSLIAINPTLPIQRGYALVYLANGKILRSVKEAAEKTNLTLHVADGKIPVTVTSKKLHIKNT